MKKILIANKFYYPRGGDCTATLSLERLLKKKGHDVAIFSTHHPQNNISYYSKYFGSEINFNNNNFKNKITAATRLFYSQEIKKKFIALINDFKPDILHVHNIHSYISPYIVEIAYKRNIKVVWTLHDYKLICPAYTCLNKGKPCEKCFLQKHNVIKDKCMKNSFPASVLAYLEAITWNRKRLEKYTDTFICPSHFLKQKMVDSGFKTDNLAVLHNFIPELKNNFKFEKEDYYCYIGRISDEKGIESLLQVAQSLPYLLKIIGDGEKLDYFKTKYKNNIEYLGYKDSEEALSIVKKARFTVIPSQWYENNPFSIIESLVMGTPVLGAAIGGIPELITENENGFLFDAFNKEELQKKIIRSHNTFTDSFNFKTISENAIEKFNADSFYNSLLNIYK